MRVTHCIPVLFAAWALFATASASTNRVECLDWDGICNAIVFVETSYPRPDIHVGIAVSINAYDEQKMRKLVGLVMGDFASAGLVPWYNFSFSGNLPWTFPGRPELKVDDFRRSYLCDGIQGCASAPGKYLDAFSMGYRRDDLNQTDAEAVRRYVHNETGGRLNATLNQACVDFAKTCMPLTPPALTTFPSVQPQMGAVLGIVAGSTIAVIGTGLGVFFLVRKCRPQLFEHDDSELQPLRQS